MSNLILFNGIPLEAVLEHAAADASPCPSCSCPSCSCLTGSERSCPTVVYRGKSYEEIPADLIRKAAFKAIGLA